MNEWVKKSMNYEMGGVRATGRPKKTWNEVIERDCQTR